jgi:hypothetical protein
MRQQRDDTMKHRDDTLLHDKDLLDKDVKVKDRDLNPDPITGERGSHPVGTGVGAVAGGATGVAVGTAIGGPVGGVVGGAIGAVAGGLAGKGVAEKVDPTVESAYWRDNYSTRPYVTKGETFDAYEPAYRYGWESRDRFAGRRFEDVETDLGRDWDRNRGASSLTWDRAKHATRDAWHHVERAMPGDADRDGR